MRQMLDHVRDRFAFFRLVGIAVCWDVRRAWRNNRDNDPGPRLG
jgi:hypothetical protein